MLRKRSSWLMILMGLFSLLLTGLVGAQDFKENVVVRVIAEVNVREFPGVEFSDVGDLEIGDVFVVETTNINQSQTWVKFNGTANDASLAGWALVADTAKTYLMVDATADAPETVPTPAPEIDFGAGGGSDEDGILCHLYQGGAETVYETGAQNPAGEFCQPDGGFGPTNPLNARTLGAGGGEVVSMDFIPFSNASGDQFAKQWWWESLCQKLPQQRALCAQDPEMMIVRPVIALAPFEGVDSLPWNVFMTIKCSAVCDGGQVQLLKPTNVHFSNSTSETVTYELTVFQDTSCVLQPLEAPCSLSSHPYWNSVLSVPNADRNVQSINGKNVAITASIRSNLDGAELLRQVYNIGTVQYSTDCTAPVSVDDKAEDNALAPIEWEAVGHPSCDVDHETNFLIPFQPGTNLVTVYTLELAPGGVVDWWIGQEADVGPEQVVFGTDMVNQDGTVCLAGESLATCSRLTVTEYLDTHG